MMGKKCFKIVGNFQQYGVWSQPDPGFIGYIVVDSSDGSFKGYMEEQYSSKHDILRLVSGVFNEKRGQLIYYKLVRDPSLSPLLYMFSDVSILGEWHAVTGIGNLVHGGSARVRLEPVELTNDILEKIETVKESVLAVSDKNRQLASKGDVLYRAFE